ncbi:hypothetical protein M0812_22485 [Anaeramoeba flamelloides]|uniref:BTB domain-containing protein n=1 Tax=Anaeramoeba flamelloides TaxID=1746091 RepID=A0AAV7Z1L7_9EUKA|nr:hypothetical protein M0812_22485 [Anaeramoeba flamelloides]
MSKDAEQIKKLLEIVEYMLQNGADPEIKDNEGQSPYSLAKNTILKKLFDGYLSYNKDFQALLDEEEMTDLKIKNTKCHKMIVEMRTGKKAEELQEFFTKKTNEELKLFLDWAYGKSVDFTDVTLFKELGIDEPHKRHLRLDLPKLFEDESSKDFTLLVHNEKIKVHKLILYARSELFKGMFQATMETEQVQDYTNKSVKTLQALVKYLYTDMLDESIEDPQILEELKDANDYYQLNPKSMMTYWIEKRETYN